MPKLLVKQFIDNYFFDGLTKIKGQDKTRSANLSKSPAMDLVAGKSMTNKRMIYGRAATTKAKLTSAGGA